MPRWRNLLFIALWLFSAGVAHAAPALEYLSGSVIPYPAAGMPSDDALVRIQLVGQGKNGKEIILSEQSLDKPRTFPAGFSMCYDKNSLNGITSLSLRTVLYEHGEASQNAKQPVERLPPSPDTTVTLKPVH